MTYTGTILSQIVKVYTRREFSHVSISLDDEIIKDQYRFGFINEETYKELIENNQISWNKLYKGE